jgi:uncharacterized protein DUF1501
VHVIVPNCGEISGIVLDNADARRQDFEASQRRREGGTSYGETDEVGHEAVENRHRRDLHATILHLMGLDHTKLAYFYNGLNQKLTGVVDAEPIEGVIA